MKTKKPGKQIMMSKKDFERIASIIHEAGRDASHVTERPLLKRVAEKMADWFSERAPRFDRQRFMDACTPEGGW